MYIIIPILIPNSLSLSLSFYCVFITCILLTCYKIPLLSFCLSFCFLCIFTSLSLVSYRFRFSSKCSVHISYIALLFIHTSSPSIPFPPPHPLLLSSFPLSSLIVYNSRSTTASNNFNNFYNLSFQ